MTTAITAVDTEQRIEHGVLIDLTLTRFQITNVQKIGSWAYLYYSTQPSVPFAPGDTIVVSGIVPTGYNGTYTVVDATTSYVRYVSATTGSATQFGNIAQTFYISNCYKDITYNSKTYQALAGFLSVSEIQTNIQNSNDELQIGLSAIPSAYINAIMGQNIKGGSINIYRAFFDYTTQDVLSGEIYKRFSGIISNFAIQEDIDPASTEPSVTHTITVSASSTMGVLENKYSGRRTNPDDYQINYGELYFTSAITTDPSMNRVMTLHNSAFDFGRPYSGKAASTTTGTATSGGNTYTYPDNDELIRQAG